MKFKPTARSAGMEYAIRDLVLPARELEQKGIDVIRLNIGDPVAFDFDTPEHIKRAMFDAILEGHNGYGDSEGNIELRQAIAEREKNKNANDFSTSDIVITTGITEGIQLLLGAMLEEGDELLVPGPTYSPYTSMTRYYGGSPVPYRTIEEEGWRPDLDDMRSKISMRTKGILVVSPNNPTGAVYSERELREICDIAGEHNLPIISDEIYDMLTFGKKHVSPSTVSRDTPMVMLNGFSKSYLVTGWRVGYAMFRDSGGYLEPLKDAFLREARGRLCASTPAQRAMVAALRGPQTHIRKMVRALKERRDYVVKRIGEMDGLSVTVPDGAFYVFPKIESDAWKSDKELVLHVLRHGHVLFVHGSGFDGKYGRMHFRSVFLAQMEKLERAMDGLENALKVPH